mmetsp:Transcript_16431/g.23447  ORF Transcript_16431/g.23447 Transcript_16431/m.23447 type:complete len:225 (-) Transcript_16431:237-911(-)
MSPTSRSDPRSYKCYLETDIRHQSLKKAKKPDGEHPPETLYSKVSSTISNYTSSWNVLKTIPQGTGKYRNSQIQKLRTSQILDSKSRIAGVWNRCQTANSEGIEKRDRKGKYDNLTFAQKVEMIVKDQMQWLKLKQSLREAGRSNFAVQQVLHKHVQQRIDEMEQLELAMYECNKNLSLRNSNKKQSRVEKSVGVEVDNVPFIDNKFSPKHVDAVKKFMLSKAA